jgi:hypothetical protein
VFVQVFIAGCELNKESAVIEVWIDQEMIKSTTGAGYNTIAAPQEYWYLDHVNIPARVRFKVA